MTHSSLSPFLAGRTLVTHRSETGMPLGSVMVTGGGVAAVLGGGVITMATWEGAEATGEVGAVGSEVVTASRTAGVVAAEIGGVATAGGG